MNRQNCRCCLLENHTKTYNIFENNIRQQLLDCVPNLLIERDDGLPDIICDICYRILHDIQEFRCKCKQNEVELRKLYEDTNNAIDEALGMINTDDASSLVNLESAMLDDLLLEDCSLCDLTDSISTKEENLQNDKENQFKDELFDIVLDKFNFENSNNFLDMTSVNNQNSKDDPHKLKNDDSYDFYSTPNVIEDKKSTVGGVTVKKTLFPCLQCGKEFTRKFQLKLHQNSVHNVGNSLTYQCSDCNKYFASRSSLNYHYKSLHSSERPFACVYCSRQFVMRTQLSSHLRIHTGDIKPRTHECKICGKCWPTKSDLRTHMRSHNPGVERPFKCDQCDKCFFSRGHLQSHIRVHTGEKPFRCSFCQKSYQNVGNVNNHMLRHHFDLMICFGLNDDKFDNK